VIAFARLVSTSVAERLRTPGRLGRVHSAYRGALNVASGDGSLLSVTGPSTGGVPNGLVLAAEADLSSAAGSEVYSDGSAVRIGGLRIELRHAALWSPLLKLRGEPAPWVTLAPLLPVAEGRERRPRSVQAPRGTGALL
jgi:hypothetical protein